MEHINGLFTLYSIYNSVSSFAPSSFTPPSHANTSFQDLKDLINYLDIEFTLQIALITINNGPKNTIDIKEAYMCLVALMEKFNTMNKSYKSMWILADYRTGNVMCLAKDIKLWHHKLITRLYFYKN